MGLVKAKLGIKGRVGIKVIRGSGHKGWSRLFVLIRDWLRLGR